MFAFVCSSCVVKLREHLYVWLLNALFTQAFPDAAVFFCVECLLEIDCCDPKCLVPLGGFPCELLACVRVICDGVAWPEACFVN